MDLHIKVEENVSLVDKVFGYKAWIGKLKGFFLIKVSPVPLEDSSFDK